MPSIKVLKANGELVEEFELTEKYKGSWIGGKAMEKACACEGDILELPLCGISLLSGPLDLGRKVIEVNGHSNKPKITYTGTGPLFDINTTRKSLLSRAIKGNE